MVAVAESEYIVTSLSAVAEFFGVSVTAVSRDWRPAGMPGEHSRYDLREIARWKRERDAKRVDQASGRAEQAHLKERLELADVRIAEADAGTKELKLRQLAGELVDRDAAHATVEEMFHRVRARLEQIPQEVANTVPPELRADVMQDWKHKVSLVLREMEGWAE